MRDPSSTFPPLLTGHKLASGIVPAEWAFSRAAKGRLGAGDLAWSEDLDDLHAALVLEPEVPRANCHEIIFAAMVAIGDAVGALSSPEIAITYRWPSIILVNDARAGSVDLLLSETEKDDAPDWMVLSVHLRLRPKSAGVEPGKNLDRTTLWDEGCGLLGRSEVLESVSRHVVNLIHLWSEDGFRPVYEHWWARLADRKPIAAGAAPGNEGQRLLGLDGTGNALIKDGAGTHVVPTMDALARLRALRANGV